LTAPAKIAILTPQVADLVEEILMKDAKLILAYAIGKITLGDLSTDAIFKIHLAAQDAANGQVDILLAPQNRGDEVDITLITFYPLIGEDKADFREKVIQALDKELRGYADINITYACLY